MIILDIDVRTLPAKHFAGINSVTDTRDGFLPAVRQLSERHRPVTLELFINQFDQLFERASHLFFFSNLMIA